MGMPVNEVLSEDQVEEPETALKQTGKKETIEGVVCEIHEQIFQILKTVSTNESRFLLRVMRSLPTIRVKLNAPILRVMVAQLYPNGVTYSSALSYVDKLPTEKSVEGPEAKAVSGKPMPPVEVDAYVTLLILVRLIDVGKLEDGAKCSDMLMIKVTELRRKRSMDHLVARCYFYHSRIAELTNKFESIRGFLHSHLRTATLTCNYETQAVLINCLLRNYLHFSLYDQAGKLVAKALFPETASSNEWARFLYYQGRIEAARLEYSSAHKHLLQALRKAPQTAAVGFRQIAQKLAVVVELLLGDIPERHLFRQCDLKRSLVPYSQLTQAVRLGNLQRFGEVLEIYETQFRQDHTYSLIVRLRHNVIRTAVRSIGVAYARISPADIAKKLGLDNAEEAEYIVAKAIRDGVIEATLDPELGYMKSRESADIYRTREPQLAFHKRISFCLGLHNQCVKAMRFPQEEQDADALVKKVDEQQAAEGLINEIIGN